VKEREIHRQRKEMGFEGRVEERKELKWKECKKFREK
jgi:hypothetical protein